MLNSVKCILWLIKTRKMSEDEILYEYKANNSLSWIYGFVACDMCIEKGEFIKALQYCEASLKRHPNSESLKNTHEKLIKALYCDEEILFCDNITMFSHKHFVFIKNTWSALWFLWTSRWDDAKKITEYKHRKSLSHVYGHAYCELYIRMMQYERALVFCEAGLEKKPDDEPLLRRRKQLMKILQREKKDELARESNALNTTITDSNSVESHNDITRQN